jgi:predicted HTH domain antitoxin
MPETTFKISLPVNLLEYGINPEDIQSHVSEWLVFSLFTDGHISSGKAAKLLNISRVEFLALLRLRGINYINYSPNEIAKELESVEILKPKKSE